MAEMRNAYSTLNRKPNRKNHLEDRDVDGNTILESILEKAGVGGCRLDSSGSG
jgi:hypothetical protein